MSKPFDVSVPALIENLFQIILSKRAFNWMIDVFWSFLIKYSRALGEKGRLNFELVYSKCSFD